MKHQKLILPAVLFACTLLFFSVPAWAQELSKADVEQAVASQGKETVTGNVFIWFLCAIAFLKVSQKIDSFLAGLGVNVGNTGGSMMAELLIAGRNLTAGMYSRGGFTGGYRRAATPGAAAVGGSFLSGGLAGSVGRQMERSAVNSATGYTGHPNIANSLYLSSLSRGGDFANKVISSIACGNYGQVGSIQGPEAQKAYISYMNLNQVTASADGPGQDPAENSSAGPTFTNVEIGGGRITGTETNETGSREFALYHAGQYTAPRQGTYETVQAADGSTWYKQYAQDTVSKTPYDAGNGKVAYHETIVRELPPVPQRKDRI